MKSAEGTSSAATVRGTQSFVGVMAEVWKRPSLTALEVAWRWAFWVLLFGCVALTFWPSLRSSATIAQWHGWGTDGLTTAAYFFMARLRETVSDTHAALLGMVAWLIWAAFSAWGRGKVLRRLNLQSSRAFGSLFLVSALRICCFVGTLALWVWVVVALTQRMILIPQTHYREPAFVPFAALMICGTLALFVIWMAASYLFQLAPVLVVEGGLAFPESIRASLRKSPLRGKLIEVNLVIGIVKIALLVLAMVFSACPLPFSSVETQSFLTCWWIGVGVWYAIASDYFHVVRTAAFLRLWEVYEIGPSGEHSVGGK